MNVTLQLFHAFLSPFGYTVGTGLVGGLAISVFSVCISEQWPCHVLSWCNVRNSGVRRIVLIIYGIKFGTF